EQREPHADHPPLFAQFVDRRVDEFVLLASQLGRMIGQSAVSASELLENISRVKGIEPIDERRVALFLNRDFERLHEAADACPEIFADENQTLQMLAVAVAQSIYQLRRGLKVARM